MFLRARWPGTLSSLGVFWASRCPNGVFLSSQATVVELLASPEVKGSPEPHNGSLRAPGDAGKRRFASEMAGKSVKFGGVLGFLVSKRPLPELTRRALLQHNASRIIRKRENDDLYLTLLIRNLR